MTERPFAPPPSLPSVASDLEARFAKLQFKSTRARQQLAAPAAATESEPISKANYYSSSSVDTLDTPSSNGLSTSRRPAVRGPRTMPEPNGYKQPEQSYSSPSPATPYSPTVGRSQARGSGSLDLLSSLPSVPSHLPSSGSSLPKSPPTYPTSSRPSSSSSSAISRVPNFSKITRIPVKKPFEFPRAVTVTPEKLATYIVEVPEQILLLDVRSREKFDEGHIYSSNIVNIDPIVLRSEYGLISIYLLKLFSRN